MRPHAYYTTGVCLSWRSGQGLSNLDSGLPHAGQTIPLSFPVGGGGITGSTAVGTSALGLRDENFKDLSAQVDTGLSHLENSASWLEAQLDSLAEVVLENGRGLDLL